MKQAFFVAAIKPISVFHIVQVNNVIAERWNIFKIAVFKSFFQTNFIVKKKKKRISCTLNVGTLHHPWLSPGLKRSRSRSKSNHDLFSLVGSPNGVATLCEIGGKTHTFWFDCGPVGEPVVVGVRSLAQKPLPYKVNGISKWLSFAFGNRYFLVWTYFAFDRFCFVLPLSFEKKKRVKYRPLWQLNFFPGHHEPVDRHWPQVKSSSFTKTARQKVQFWTLNFESCRRTSRWNLAPFDRLRWKTCLAFD